MLSSSFWSIMIFLTFCSLLSRENTEEILVETNHFYPLWFGWRFKYLLLSVYCEPWPVTTNSICIGMGQLRTNSVFTRVRLYIFNPWNYVQVGPNWWHWGLIISHGDILNAHISPCPLLGGDMGMTCPLPFSPGLQLVWDTGLLTLTLILLFLKKLTKRGPQTNERCSSSRLIWPIIHKNLEGNIDWDEKW